MIDTGLELIRENKYSHIYRTGVDGEPLILKRYKPEGTGQFEEDARGLEIYHDIARRRPDLIDSRVVRRDGETRTLLIGFVRGDPLRDIIYRGRRDTGARRQSLGAMSVLGSLLREILDTTAAPGEETDEFHFRYLRYCSGRLPAVARGHRGDAEEIIREYLEATVTPSFAHGDLVFVNIHVDGARVGLIDFANSSCRSHLLNDLYALWFALENMWLPGGYRKDLWSALMDPVGKVPFPPEAHRFWREYHRRRWLMLKIRTRNPRNLLQALRGLATFARPSGQPGEGI